MFIMPSFTETFGMVYAEALTQGLPVIYTRGEGFDGNFDEGEVGYSVNSSNYIEISDRILKIIKNYDKISGNCVTAANKFEWTNICKKYELIYKKIVLREE